MNISLREEDFHNYISSHHTGTTLKDIKFNDYIRLYLFVPLFKDKVSLDNILYTNFKVDDTKESTIFTNESNTIYGQIVVPGHKTGRVSCYVYFDKHNKEAQKSIARLKELFTPYQKITDENTRVIEQFSINKGYVESHKIYFSIKNAPEIHDILYPDIDIDLLIKDYFTSKDSILLLYGSPGTGKTSFIKKVLYSEYFEEAAYVKDVNVLVQDTFWSSAKNCPIIILDDLDCDLTASRAKSDPIVKQFMSYILSFSDGITTSMGKTIPKIIITTNQNITEIDSALVRPGRCFDFIHIAPLTSANARDIWVNYFKLSNESFDIHLGALKTISQSQLMNERTRHLDKKSVRAYMKHGSKTYSIEERIQELGINISRGADGDNRKASF